MPPPLPLPSHTPSLTVVSPQGDGETPLHWGSRMGHVAVVQYLAETAKASVEAKNVSGGRLLSHLLSPHPTHPCPRCVSPQNNGWTPLHFASSNGNVAVVQYLVLATNADVKAKDVSLLEAKGTGDV